MLLTVNPVSLPPTKVDISLLLKPNDEEEETAPVTTEPAYPSRPVLCPPTSTAAPATPAPLASLPPLSAKISPAVSGTKRSAPTHSAEPPAKKQSKWSPEEDALIIELRGRGMKWEDISKRLPGRSAISCRLHYQNYLERRSEWDEDKKNKLARLYERFKADMWSKVAEEMAIPWRAAEAMHWQLGEQEMARRAGVVPFSLSSTAVDPSVPRSRRSSTSFTRPRKVSAPARTHAQHLPSVEELTAGVPAFAGPPREPYPIARPPELSGNPASHPGPSLGLPPRSHV